jgi:hypothetical protein
MVARVYPQYFDFGEANRKDERGRAMGSPVPNKAIPRVLESGGSFGFGGPVVPASRGTELELGLIKNFEHISKTRGLKLPILSDKEDEA